MATKTYLASSTVIASKYRNLVGTSNHHEGDLFGVAKSKKAFIETAKSHDMTIHPSGVAVNDRFNAWVELVEAQIIDPAVEALYAKNKFGGGDIIRIEENGDATVIATESYDNHKRCMVYTAA